MLSRPQLPNDWGYGHASGGEAAGGAEAAASPADGLAWTQPACSPSAHLVAAAAGPVGGETRFGRERRSIYLAPLGGGAAQRLTGVHSATVTDDDPRFSRDGRSILFIRIHTAKGAGYHGYLYLLHAAEGHWSRARLIGPIADLGRGGFGYYGHCPWACRSDWNRGG